MKNADMFADLSTTQAWRLFAETTYPWEVLPQIKAFVRALGPTLSPAEYDHPSEEAVMTSLTKVQLTRSSDL